MFCNNCGKEIPLGQSSCEFCGFCQLDKNSKILNKKLLGLAFVTILFILRNILLYFQSSIKFK